MVEVSFIIKTSFNIKVCEEFYVKVSVEQELKY